MDEKHRAGCVDPIRSVSLGGTPIEGEAGIGKTTLAYLDLPSLRPALRTSLQAAANALLARRPACACRALTLYIAAVRIAPARAFTAAEKAELIADATRIRAVIGCR